MTEEGREGLGVGGEGRGGKARERVGDRDALEVVHLYRRDPLFPARRMHTKPSHSGAKIAAPVCNEKREGFIIISRR
jgi:hypothetical protein